MEEQGRRGPGRPARWPWDRWLDGGEWRVDFGAGDAVGATRLVGAIYQAGAKSPFRVAFSQRRGTYADGAAFFRVTLQAVPPGEPPRRTHVKAALARERRAGGDVEAGEPVQDTGVGVDPATHGGVAHEELVPGGTARWPWDRWFDGAAWVVDFAADALNGTTAARATIFSLAPALDRRNATLGGAIAYRHRPVTYADGGAGYRLALQIDGAGAELEALVEQAVNETCGDG